MAFINEEELETLSTLFKDPCTMENHFKKLQTKYKHQFNYSRPEEVLQRARKVNNNLEKKAEIEAAKERTELFAFGQLKVFTWAVAVLCFSGELSLQQLDQEHFQLIKKVFSCKSLNFIRYETLCLAHEKSKYNPAWSEEEIKLLTQIINQKQDICEWRQISFQLFEESQGGFYRPFQQCREKWFNHLDPKVRKGKWTIEEDIALLSAVECLDCKWIEIYRELGGVRTEHMIKNRYKSILKKWKKKYEKTSPKKIVAMILKHLKAKVKRGDLNSSMSSNQNQEVPIPKKLNKKPIQSEPIIIPIHSEPTIEPFASLQTDQTPEKEEDTRKEEAEDFEFESEFSLGFGCNGTFTNNWGNSELPAEESPELAMGRILERAECFFRQEIKEDRKTAEDEDEDEEREIFGLGHLQRKEPEMIEVSGFDSLRLEDSDSAWLRSLNDRWENDIDDVYGY